MPTRPPRQKQYPDEGHLSLDRRGYPQSGLCHSTSVSAMNRALSTAAASGSMREIEEAADIIFIAGANATESHPVFGALIKRAWGVPEKSLSLENGMMVTEMTQDDSPIRGLYIMGENPVISDPNIAHAEEWVRGLEFLAVQDLFLTETARWADVVLPGSSFAEKSGTYVNTERRIQLTEAALDPPGMARRDLDILIELSNRLGLRTTWTGPEDVMREIASVTPSWRGVTYPKLRNGGLQYPVLTPESKGTAFLFADAFPTADG